MAPRYLSALAWAAAASVVALLYAVAVLLPSPEAPDAARMWGGVLLLAVIGTAVRIVRAVHSRA